MPQGDFIKIGVICCLLDSPLTLLWGNSSFFRINGHTAGDFHDLFKLRSSLMHSIRMALLESAPRRRMLVTVLPRGGASGPKAPCVSASAADAGT